MYINWFAWIIFFDDCIFYTNKSRVTIIIQFSQCNVKLTLPRLKQDNYTVIPIHDTQLESLTETTLS